MSSNTLDGGTHIGTVALRVSSLARSVDFYTDILGLRVLPGDGRSEHTLGVENTPLIVLVEDADAPPRPRRTMGLYHFAILHPSRIELARGLRRIVEHRWPVTGASDHLVSEAIYLNDPDGNGIEIYRDRPRDQWTVDDGRVRMAVEPLDLSSLLKEAEAETEMHEEVSPATTMGHIHLNVADIAGAESFYGNLLGFDTTFKMPGALFVSAGGYHHHLGLNTWNGPGAPPAPEGSLGLKHFNIVLPNVSARDAAVKRLTDAGHPAVDTPDGPSVMDPSGNKIVFVSETS